MFTHDALMKWYFASNKYTLLEVGIKLMLAHKCKNLTNVCSMSLYVRLSAHSPAMDEYIVEVTLCEVSHRSQQICNTSLNVEGALLSPCGITIHSQSIPLGVLTAVYRRSRSRIRIS